MRAFGQILRELRNEKGLSAVALGKAVGINNSTIIRWENCNIDITSDYLVKLAQFFEVSTDYLLGLEN